MEWAEAISKAVSYTDMISLKGGYSMNYRIIQFAECSGSKIFRENDPGIAGL